MIIRTGMLKQMVIDLLVANLSLGMVLAAIREGYRFDVMLHLFASLAAAVILYSHGIYHRLWQFAGVRDYLKLLQGVILYTVVLAAGLCFYPPVELSPLAAAMLVCVYSFLAGGWRAAWRASRELGIPGIKEQKARPALVVGAGGAGILVARTLQDNRSILRPVGFVDDDPGKQGMSLIGLPILGSRGDIPRLADKYRIEEIIIAIPSAGGKEISEIVKLSRHTDARLKILPSVYSMIGGKIPEGQIRDIQVEDLLNRKPVKLDLEVVGEYIKDKVALVTGAGGSVGSELCVQLAGFSPQALVVLGRGENSIYEIEARLNAGHPSLRICSEIADVRDRERIRAIFNRYRPAVVFHAAAHKHVPLMEKSPAEAFKNNVIGTLNAALAAAWYQAESFVLISTDKAVNPTSVMGATKQLAERVIRELGEPGGTRFVAVRFGNVMGSRGSVIPVFKRQIAAGGPVTVTHPEMVRYFMTISEAAQLVIEAGAIARGGEVFVLDMGEPVRIMDLALNMIKLSGYRPEKDIVIKFTGVRPGEKLYEELYDKNETLHRTEHEKIFLARSDVKPKGLVNFLNQLADEQISDDQAALEIICRLVKKFNSNRGEGS